MYCYRWSNKLVEYSLIFNSIYQKFGISLLKAWGRVRLAWANSKAISGGSSFVGVFAFRRISGCCCISHRCTTRC
ncbi:hypothetical protein BIW11_10722 [Tropilaelaps mercedesae]|uniref:Uncharacterized protein n=1 Tax=Tropilaelaps mercedesae TaxID=418985 RepID=A0A1V9XEG2_9ACAR|nr:hypothetical protein BIW11_10722 [Tropilaelaps mercedesae]